MQNSINVVIYSDIVLESYSVSPTLVHIFNSDLDRKDSNSNPQDLESALSKPIMRKVNFAGTYYLL